MNVGSRRLGNYHDPRARDDHNAEVEGEPGSSARIEHIGVDGDLDIEIDDFGVRRGPNQY